LLPPDTPPAEYLYLDSDRVLAYLGQIDGGLPTTAKRTSMQMTSQSGTLKGGLIAEVTGSAERQTSIEETVTPAATDRFYDLLQKLRNGAATRAGRRYPWLSEMNAMLGSDADAAKAYDGLARLREGDFVRLENAHLFLPRYAALAPRARYARAYAPGDLLRRPAPLDIAAPARQDRDVKRYLRSLGADPVLPFVVPSLWTSTGLRSVSAPTFLVPARYSALLDNARLVSGNLSIVGKVIYIGRRNADRPDCAASDASSKCSYLDRQTVATFAPALARARHSVLELLRMSRGEIAPDVIKSVRFKAPFVVILPVAIYQ
jgi:hypothetical protein